MTEFLSEIPDLVVLGIVWVNIIWLISLTGIE